MLNAHRWDQHCGLRVSEVLPAVLVSIASILPLALVGSVFSFTLLSHALSSLSFMHHPAIVLDQTA